MGGLELEWAWPGCGGPAPGVLRAVSLCRVEDEDLLLCKFCLSLSDDDVDFFSLYHRLFFLLLHLNVNF